MCLHVDSTAVGLDPLSEREPESGHCVCVLQEVQRSLITWWDLLHLYLQSLYK